jgi:glutamate/aspartate transport system permease protein
VSERLDWSVLWSEPYGEIAAHAVAVTIHLSLLAWAAALVLGTLAGVARGAPNAVVRLAATAYVELFRNVPLLVQLFFAYYVLPRLLPIELRRELFALGWEMGSAILTLSLYTSAKVAEHVRAGLNTVGRQVRWGALSTGLTWWQAQRYVIAPLLLRIMVPSLTSEFVTVFKSSSLAMTVGVVETSYVTQQIGFQTFHWIEASVFGTAVYLGCAWLVAALMACVERWVHVPGLIRRGEGS